MWLPNSEILTGSLLAQALRRGRHLCSVSPRFTEEDTEVRVGLVVPRVVRDRVSAIRRKVFPHLVLIVLVASCSSLGISTSCGTLEYDHDKRHDRWGDVILWANREISLEWTPDGRHIVTSFGFGDNYVVAADGSSVRRVTSGKGKYVVDYSPDVSPDGTRVAYATSRHRTGDDTWIRLFEIETSGLDGSDRKRVTVNRNLDTSPAWSPDGTRIAFVKLRIADRSVPSGIYTIAADGSDERAILTHVNGLPDSTLHWGPEWSPDGGTLAFAVASGVNSLYAVETDGSGFRELFHNESSSSSIEVSHVDWSPDGQWMAFSSYKSSYSDPETNLYVIGSNGEGLTDLLSDVEQEPPVRRIFDLEWSPGGSRILFSAGILAKGYVFLINADGSGFRRITEGHWATWSPDGSRIAVRDHSEGALVSMALDGSDVRVLARDDGDNRLVAVSPR